MRRLAVLIRWIPGARRPRPRRGRRRTAIGSATQRRLLRDVLPRVGCPSVSKRRARSATVGRIGGGRGYVSASSAALLMKKAVVVVPAAAGGVSGESIGDVAASHSVRRLAAAAIRVLVRLRAIGKHERREKRLEVIGVCVDKVAALEKPFRSVGGEHRKDAITKRKSGNIGEDAAFGASRRANGSRGGRRRRRRRGCRRLRLLIASWLCLCSGFASGERLGGALRRRRGRWLVAARWRSRRNGWRARG